VGFADEMNEALGGKVVRRFGIANPCPGLQGIQIVAEGAVNSDLDLRGSLVERSILLCFRQRSGHIAPLFWQWRGRARNATRSVTLIAATTGAGNGKTKKFQRPHVAPALDPPVVIGWQTL
jgi:hypothetical protein